MVCVVLSSCLRTIHTLYRARISMYVCLHQHARRKFVKLCGCVKRLVCQPRRESRRQSRDLYFIVMRLSECVCTCAAVCLCWFVVVDDDDDHDDGEDDNDVVGCVECCFIARAFIACWFVYFRNFLCVRVCVCAFIYF